MIWEAVLSERLGDTARAEASLAEAKQAMASQPEFFWITTGNYRLMAADEEGAEAAVPKVRDAVRSGLERSVEEALPNVRSEVAEGVRDGAESVVPALRRQVRDGVEEAIAAAMTGGVLGKAGEELARKGTSVISRILGAPEDE